MVTADGLIGTTTVTGLPVHLDSNRVPRYESDISDLNNVFQYIIFQGILTIDGAEVGRRRRAEIAGKILA